MGYITVIGIRNDHADQLEKSPERMVQKITELTRCRDFNELEELTYGNTVVIPVDIPNHASETHFYASAGNTVIPVSPYNKRTQAFCKSSKEWMLEIAEKMEQDAKELKKLIKNS